MQLSEPHWVLLDELAAMLAKDSPHSQDVWFRSVLLAYAGGDNEFRRRVDQAAEKVVAIAESAEEVKH